MQTLTDAAPLRQTPPAHTTLRQHRPRASQRSCAAPHAARCPADGFSGQFQRKRLASAILFFDHRRAPEIAIRREPEGGSMDRRLFLKSLFAVAGTLGATSIVADGARAMPVADPAAGAPLDLQTAPAVATPEDIDAARIEDVRWVRRRRRRWIFRRRRRRVFWRRRRYFRRRRFIGRRRRFIRRYY